MRPLDILIVGVNRSREVRGNDIRIEKRNSESTTERAVAVARRTGVVKDAFT